jgi:hypothetical protein
MLMSVKVKVNLLHCETDFAGDEITVANLTVMFFFKLFFTRAVTPHLLRFFVFV